MKKTKKKQKTSEIFFFCFFTRAKDEAHFLKKIALVTKKCLVQGAFRKSPRATGNLSKYKAVREKLCTNFLISSIQKREL